MPRSSEIWPQPMGHHIFMWRIPKATEGGHLEIKNNIFAAAPVGASIYSIISPEAEWQIELDHNIYIYSGVLINRFGGVNYSDFFEYQKSTGQDINSFLKAN